MQPKPGTPQVEQMVPPSKWADARFVPDLESSSDSPSPVALPRTSVLPVLPLELSPVRDVIVVAGSAPKTPHKKSPSSIDWESTSSVESVIPALPRKSVPPIRIPSPIDIESESSIESLIPSTTRSRTRIRPSSPINTESPIEINSPLGSTGSFPESPFHTQSEARKKATVEDASTIYVAGPVSHTSSIKDSDEDDGVGSNDDDDGNNDMGMLPLSTSLSTTESFSSSSLGASQSRTRRRPPRNSANSSSPNIDDGEVTPPLAKRRANTLAASPLPLRRGKQPRLAQQTNLPKLKHRFDMKALLQHAQQDEAAEAAVQRVASVFAEMEKNDSNGGDCSPQHDARHRSQKVLDGLLNGTEVSPTRRDREDGSPSQGKRTFNKERLRRAFDRTEVAVVSTQWFFFKEPFSAPPSKRQPFPLQVVCAPKNDKSSGSGNCWAFLEDDVLRADYFEMGIVRRLVASLPRMADSQGTTFPDELFLWILDEACVEPRPALRAAYAAVLRVCPPKQVQRLVDIKRLRQLFQRLGPRDEGIDLEDAADPNDDAEASMVTPFKLVSSVENPYPGRDWAPLRGLLALLSHLAPLLTLNTVRNTVTLLLRLGIDRMVEETPDVLQDYQEALRQLLSAVPTANWDAFCYHACRSLYVKIQKYTLRWQVVAVVPSDVPACHALRRRLAAVFLFEDTARGRLDPDCTFPMNPRSGSDGGGSEDGNEGSLASLALREGFVLTEDTDYAELASEVNLLDVYLDDAGRKVVVAPLQSVTVSANQFNADIDALTQRLADVNRGVDATSGGGHVPRLDSKTALERLQIRLSQTVRTRQRSKRNVYERGTAIVGPASRSGGTGGANDESGRSRDGSVGTGSIQPQQKDIRDFFALKKAETGSEELTG